MKKDKQQPIEGDMIFYTGPDGATRVDLPG